MHAEMGRVLALQYRDSNVHVGDGRHTSVDALRVHFRTPDGSVDHHDLPNGSWALTSPALQYLAVLGMRPSDLDTYTNIDDEYVFLQFDKEHDAWRIHERVLAGADAQLAACEWFDPEPFTGDDERPHSADMGGGGPDPGTGNQGAVDHDTESESDESGVTVEMAPADSDRGVNVSVE